MFAGTQSYSMMIFSRKALLIAAIAAISVPVSAQLKQFTMAEATNGLQTTLAPESIRQASWHPSGNAFFFTAKGKWVRMNVPSWKTDTLLGLQALNRMLPAADTLKNFPAIGWLSANEAWFRAGQTIRFLRIEGDKISMNGSINLPEKAENITFASGGKMIAFTVDNNLKLLQRGAEGSKEGIRSYDLTIDKDPNIINGQSVHRNEFGIDNGIFFSPKGNLLAYYRMDQTMVSDYPVVSWQDVPAKADLIKYPMAGGVSHEVTVRVFNPKTMQTVTLQTGTPADQYLTCVSWSPDEKYVFVALLNRDQNHLRLNRYDAATGALINTLFEEKSDKYVEPQQPLHFLPGRNDQFLWHSQRDGFMHLYLYDTAGRQVRQLTKGTWVVNGLLGFNSARKEVLYTSSAASPLEQHAYAVNWTNGKIRRLDMEPGTHQVLASPDGRYIFDTYSAFDVPKRSLIRSVDGKHSKLLLNAPDPLTGYERPIVRQLTLKADDGTPLYGRVILPTGFDSTRQYPVIVYLYNGPHVQLVKNQYPASGNLWYEYLAQRGYIVFTMDGRGSSNRGLAFEQATFRQLGTVELQDQLQGVAFLRSLPYVDTARMGIHGWSYGGFMATSMMLRHPGVFKAAVAGGPVIDWRMYEIMYTERYMDTPKDNPEGYATANLLDKVQNLKGKLLLIHGTDDDVVVWQHSLRFLKQCVDKGVQVDYFVYPGHPHNVRGRDRIHLMQKITDYFDQHLR
jgi:dipeptidyl-peptidase-4